MQETIVEVDVLPLQAEQFSEPEPGEECGAKQRCVVVAAGWLGREFLGRLKQRFDLAVAPDVVLAALVPTRPLSPVSSEHGLAVISPRRTAKRIVPFNGFK
jgi:hypothetical protein